MHSPAVKRLGLVKQEMLPTVAYCRENSEDLPQKQETRGEDQHQL